MAREEKARKIIELVDGMTEAEWSKIRLLINRQFEDKKAKLTFEKPEHLDLLMKQNLLV